MSALSSTSPDHRPSHRAASGLLVVAFFAVPSSPSPNRQLYSTHGTGSTSRQFARNGSQFLEAEEAPGRGRSGASFIRGAREQGEYDSALPSSPTWSLTKSFPSHRSVPQPLRSTGRHHVQDYALEGSAQHEGEVDDLDDLQGTNLTDEGRCNGCQTTTFIRVLIPSLQRSHC